MEVLAKTETADYEIHQIGCNVCKPPKEEGFIQNIPDIVPQPKAIGNMMIWIIVILLILLFVGLLFMKRPDKKSRR